MAKKADIAQVKVRMPKALQRKLQRAAEQSGQTLNAEILKRLDDSRGEAIVRDAVEGVRLEVEKITHSERFRELAAIAQLSKQYLVSPEEFAAAIDKIRKDKEPQK